MRRSVFTEDHEAFRETVRDFIAKEVTPEFPEWEKAGQAPRDFYRKLGELGVFGISVPVEYGGAGETSIKYEAVISEETARAAVTFGGSGVHVGLCLGYLMRYATEEQKHRWMPDFVSGETMYAIAMTEPGTGSDLAGMSTRAELSDDGTHYVLNGAKTFITGGVQADRVLVVCRTSPAPEDNRRIGLSILVVDAHAEGFAVGRKLDKIGMRTSDTAELSFSDVEVPVEDLLGDEGQAFSYLSENLVKERLVIGIGAASTATAAIRFALDYVKERQVFGKPVASFQNTKFVLAECAAEVEAAAGDGGPGHGPVRRGRADAGRRVEAEGVRHRDGGPGHRQVPSAARRLRLHARVPDRPPVRRHPRQPDLRRHERGPEDRHRQVARPVTCPVRTGPPGSGDAACVAGAGRACRVGVERVAHSTSWRGSPHSVSWAWK